MSHCLDPEANWASTWDYGIDQLIIACTFTVKLVLSGHSKIDKTKILMTAGSLVKVERPALSENGS